MTFSKIFKFFLFICCFCCFISPAKAKVYTLNGNCEFEFSPTNELFAPMVMEYAGELDVQLEKIFPKRKDIDKKSRRNFRIILLDGTSDSMHIEQKKRNISISINGISPSFQGDYIFLYNLFTALLFQRMPYENEDVQTKWRMPQWVFMAMHAKIKNSFSGRRILRSSRQMPGMRIFLEMGFFPDPLLIERASFRYMSSIEIFLLQDYCRFLLDLSTMFSKAGKNPVGFYLRELYLANNTTDPAIFQRLIMRPLQQQAELHLTRILDDPKLYNEKQQMDIFMKFHAGHLAFSYSNPASSTYLKKYFKELQKVRFIELNAEKKPTGKVIESHISNLPQLIRQHINARNVLQLKKGELLHFRSIASTFFTAETNELIELLSNVKDSRFFGTSTEEITRAIKKIEQKLEQFRKIEIFLEETETKKLSPFQIFPYEFSIEKEHRNTTVPESFLKKLEEVEKSYLK